MKALSFQAQISELSTANLLDLISCGGFTNQEATIAANLLVDRIHMPRNHKPNWRMITCIHTPDHI